MYTHKLVLFVFLLCSTLLTAQDNSNVPVRTPEQEATRQTEKLRQELNLNAEQVKQVYEINLHYAKLRQTSNSRTEAMERVKRKNADLKRILNAEQYDKLQNKHYERSTYQIPNEQQRPVRTTPRPATQAPKGPASTPKRSTETPGSRQDSTRPSVRPTTQPGRRPATQPATRSSRSTRTSLYQRSTAPTRSSATYRTPGSNIRSSAPASYSGRTYSPRPSRQSGSIRR